MVVESLVDARLLQDVLQKSKFGFSWFLKSAENEYSAGAIIDGMFRPNHTEQYLELTQGIDKKYNLVLLFTDEYDLDFQLIIQVGTKTRRCELATLLERLGIKDVKF
jgi:hypothetical protein